ncbi:MAG: phosphotransferase [Sphaerospermopsis sp. SIO1G2]|nr:phosphotransferase [Sphaerospermopsis sp. SIO1G2]
MVGQKSAAIVNFLSGKSVLSPGLSHITQAGSYLGKLHLTAQNFTMTRRNHMSFDAWERLLGGIRERTSTLQDNTLLKLLGDELTYQQQHWPHDLPRGIIHADMFPNNVFFDEAGQLSGIIDFYFACHDMLAYDLAIVANAWCMDAQGHLIPSHYDALLAAYQQQRPLLDEELQAMPCLLRAAALRFLLTRTYDMLTYDADALVVPHDPYVYARILTAHQSAVQHAC